MMEYKRLTFRHKSVDGTEQIGYTEKLVGCYRKEEMILNRLAELEDKIEQGTLIELPCKVGDTVYLIEMDWDEDCKSFYYITEEDFMFQHLDYFGAYCFLTREEAEKRLKELQE